MSHVAHRSSSFIMAFVPSACLLVLLAFLSYSAAEICKNPQVNSKSYTTTDATVVVNIAFVAEFNVTCANNVQNLNLYADVDGKRLLPVTKSPSGDKYQVSWTEDVKQVSSGDHPVKVYDEEGFAALRKAQRSGDDVAAIPPLFLLTVTHAGTYNGPWVQSEVMAAVLAVLVWYFAYSAKSKLEA